MKMHSNLEAEAAEDASDARAIDDFRRKLAEGNEELIPLPIVDRFLEGENPIKVWREYRGLNSRALAERAGVGRSLLSQIETRTRSGTADTLRKIAGALGLTTDDLLVDETDECLERG